MSDKKQINPIWAACKPFVNGGSSGMLSTMLIQPIDMIKVRIQLGEKGSPVSHAALSCRLLALLPLMGQVPAGAMHAAAAARRRTDPASLPAPSSPWA